MSKSREGWEEFYRHQVDDMRREGGNREHFFPDTIAQANPMLDATPEDALFRTREVVTFLRDVMSMPADQELLTPSGQQGLFLHTRDLAAVELPKALNRFVHGATSPVRSPGIA